jgi:hypothetical protein
LPKAKTSVSEEKISEKEAGEIPEVTTRTRGRRGE